MNKRQKKKSLKQTLIKIRKLHPSKCDVICFQPDLEWVDIDTMYQFMELYADNKIFGEASLALVPVNIEQIQRNA